MRLRFVFIIMLVSAFFVAGCTAQEMDSTKTKENRKMNENKVKKTEDEWKGCLSPEEYRVLREKGTEMAFTGKYYKHKADGMYHCAACDAPLFSSDTKYESGSGWPSFYKPASEGAVKEKLDTSYGMVRKEIVCGACDSHLGHVFEDGPNPTGLRYCVNSVSLSFEGEKEKKKNKDME